MPYQLSDLKWAFLNFETNILEDTSKCKNILGLSFPWSYDRLPYCADFLEFINLKAMGC